MINITWCFKQILLTVELIPIVSGGDYKIITVVQYVLRLILCSYDLILHLCACLHFSRIQMALCKVSICMCISS